MNRRSFNIKSLAVLLAAGPASYSAASPTLRIVTEEFPPYNLMEGGRVTGFSTEVVEAVLVELGLSVPIQSMPWARAYDTAKNGENVLIYSITRTAGREQMFKWVGVVAPSEWSLFSTRSRPISLTRLEDAKRFQVATVNEDAGEQYRVARGFAIGGNLQSSNKYEFNYEKLRRGRVDLWVANDLVAHYLARKAGDDPAQTLVRSLPLPDLGGGDGLYMAFGLKTPDEMVERFRRGLEAVRQKGIYDALKKKWL
jgi:polar amino acid transport system substrate-binding protein